MDHTCSIVCHWISVVCSAVSIQEKMAEQFGQFTSSIAGFYIAVGSVQRASRRNAPSVNRFYDGTTTGIHCYVCNIQTSFMVWCASEMPAGIAKSTEVVETKVARPQVCAARAL